MIVRLALVLVVSCSALASALTPAETRGRHIYRHGESSAGRPITALAGGTELAASIFACASCHGADGRGVPEGSVEPSDIRWSTLQKISLAGRKRPRYDDEHLARAIREGVDPAGNRLSPVMPRFRISDDDLADLIAYLKRLGNEPQPGLTPEAITITTLDSDPRARAIVGAYLDDVNAAGGIFGRTLHLADIPAQEAFAVVGGADAGFGDERIPLITAFPSPSPAPSSFFLFPDLEAQALALAERAAPAGRAIHVLHDDTPAARAAAAALTPRTSASEWTAIVRAPRADGDVLFFIGRVDVAAAMRELHALRWAPRVLIAGAETGSAVFAAPATVSVFVATPHAPGDLTEEGLRELHAFSQRHRIAAADLAPRVATYAALTVLVEGLKRAGRDLTREKLITSLEQLYQFSTGLTPPITYARNRHIGSARTHILAVDPRARALVPLM